MIGKIYTSTTPYFDVKINKNAFKQRPVLIISEARNNDYTVLPISTITKKENIDDDYDIKIEPNDFPLLNLNRTSYIRTHKQTVIHRSSLYKELGDLKVNYEDVFLNVLAMLEEFNKRLMNNALE